MSFLKLGATALKVPLAVRFDNIHLNQCYQLMAGSKVVTEFDESRGNVATLGSDDEGTAYLISEYLAIQSLLEERLETISNTPEDHAFITNLQNKLTDLKASITNAEIDPDIKTTLLDQSVALENYMDCSATPFLEQGARKSRTESVCSLNPWLDLAKCLGGASLDIFGSYAFKWLELNVEGNSSVSFTNFSGVTSQMDWSGTLQSAAVSCVFSVIPIPSGKAALAAMSGAAGLSATEAFTSNVLSQYNTIQNSHSTPSAALRNINWQQAVTAASGAGMITFVSTALVRSSSHASIQALKNKLVKIANNKGASYLRAQLTTLGFSSSHIDDIFARWGISEIKTLPNLAFWKPFSKINYRDNLKILTGNTNVPSTTQAHHVFPQSQEFEGKWNDINIHDPRFLQWWEAPDHQKNDSAYRAEWRAFFLFNSNPTQSEIFRKGREIMSSFGKTVHY
jgi:hypothetical protein